MIYHIDIAIYPKEWTGNMNEIVEEVQVLDVWVVATIGDSTDEYSTRPMIFEQFCETEQGAIHSATRYSSGIVFPAKLVRTTATRQG